ncbi:MAG TPA: FtsX-like permease family protein, partial [Flavihumibacter sp.]
APSLSGGPDKLVINQQQARALGWAHPDEAIGQLVRIADWPEPFTISGVVQDYPLGSMQDAIQPQTYVPVSTTRVYRYLSIKLSSGSVSGNLAALERTWRERLPGAPFEYEFLDSSIENLYKTELQLKKAGYTALALSLILVLLGVTGLVSISLQKRIKEIGVRKVLGASPVQIIRLFLKEFLGLALVSTAFACPIAWYLSRRWLNEYAYRIELTPMPFILSMLALCLLTSILITLISYRQSLVSPARSLQSE